MTEYDTQRKVEETETGFRTTIKSKRGTGTRDQDEVYIQAETETYPDKKMLAKMEDDVTDLMEQRRNHNPDESEEDDNDD